MNSKVVIDFIANASSMTGGVNNVIGGLDKVQAATKRVRQALFGMGVGIGGSLAAAGYKAASFEEDMRNVNSIVQATDVTFQKTSDSVLNLATQLPRSAGELAKGAYQIVSAGFTAPKQTIDILTQSGKAASAGLTSVDTAALAVVTALNAYGEAAGSAENVSDLLFQTVNVGQVSFEQLATNLGDFIGIANAAGGTLAETLSAYASVTVATGQASRAATSIQGVYRAFVKPSEAMTAAIEKQGYASGKQMIQTLGLQGTLDALTASVGGSEVAIAQLFQDTEGLSGVLALTGPNADRAREGLTKFTDKEQIAGATTKALSEQAKSFNYQFDQLKSTIGAVAIEFGQRVLPVMKGVTKGFQFFASILHDIPGPAKTLLTIFAGLLAVVTTVGIGMAMWGSRLNFLLIGLRTIAGTGAAQSLLAIARSSAVATTATTALSRATGMSVGGLGKLAKGIGAVSLAYMLFEPATNFMMDLLNGKPDVDAMTEALIQWGNAGTYAGTRLTENFGEGLGRIIGDVKKVTKGEGNSLLGDALGAVGLEDLDAQRDASVKRIDELDKAFAKLVGGGNVTLAKSQFANVEAALLKEGVAANEVNQMFNDYKDSMVAADEANKGAANSATKNATAQETVVEKMKAADEAAEEYAKTIEDLQSQTREWLSLGNVLGKIEDAHKKQYDTAEAARKALEDQEKATKANSEAQEKMSITQLKVNRLQSDSKNTIPGTAKYEELLRAQDELADSAGGLRDAQAGVNAEYQKTPPTMEELTTTYQEVIDGYNSFQANLNIAASRGVDFGVIKELQGMGEEGIEIAAMLASAAPEEFEKLKGVLAEKVRLESESYQRELDTQLATAAAISRIGANKTYQAIMDEILKIAPGINAELPHVQAAMARLGFATNPGEIVPDNYVGPLTTNQVRSKDLPTSAAQPPGEKDPWGRTVVSKTIAGPLTPQEVYSSIADRGAVVKPGFNLIQNKTPLPEYVLTAAQMQGLIPVQPKAPPANMRPVESKSTTYQFGDIYAQDLTAAMRQADQKKRLAALAG